MNPNAATPPDAVADDAMLMRCIAGGDVAALASLVRRHEQRIRSIAYRFVGNGPDADDVAQECFIRVWQAAGDYQPSAPFTTWLYRIVVNLCLDRRRRAGRQPARLTERDDVARDMPPASIEQEEIVRAVRAAIQALPERQRIVLVLHRYDGRGHREIAEMTGWSESAVESLLTRAYAALRQRLARIV